MNESILDEAARIVEGDRNNVYGHPLDDFTAVGKQWAIYLTRWLDTHHPGLLNGPIPDIPPSVVACLMIALKINRVMKTLGHRDSLVDIAGYARCSDMCAQEQDRRDTLQYSPEVQTQEVS